jgi:hypothetical protein
MPLEKQEALKTLSRSFNNVASHKFLVSIFNFIWMNHYILLISHNTGQNNETNLRSPEHRQLMFKWVQDLSRSGQYVAAKSIGGERRMIEGDDVGTANDPLVLVNSYVVVAAETIDQAADLAMDCPMLGEDVKCVEIRRLSDL